MGDWARWIQARRAATVRTVAKKKHGGRRKGAGRQREGFPATVRLRLDQWAALDKLAERLDVSRSEALRRVLDGLEELPG